MPWKLKQSVQEKKVLSQSISWHLKGGLLISVCSMALLKSSKLDYWILGINWIVNKGHMNVEILFKLENYCAAWLTFRAYLQTFLRYIWGGNFAPASSQKHLFVADAKTMYCSGEVNRGPAFCWQVINQQTGAVSPRAQAGWKKRKERNIRKRLLYLGI